MDQQVARDNAIAALRNRGELLPDDSTMVKRQQFVGGPVPATIEERVLGPNAQENARRINAEMEKMRKEAEGAERAASGFVDELEDAAPQAEKTTAQLERQAQLLEQSNAKRRKAYETENALTEARLTGNKALEESILQAEDFNTVLEETDSFETAANTAAVRAAARRAEQEASPASTGGAVGGGGGTFSEAIQTINERIAEMRGNANARAADAAAKRFEEGRFFRSAVNAQDRAQRAKDRAMQGARIKDILGGKNMGEAYRDYAKTTGMDRMSQKDFEKSIRDQAATPEERTRAENRANKSGKDSKEGGSTNDPMKAVVDIYKLLTERLPIHVLAA
jgi:hypothetical protein